MFLTASKCCLKRCKASTFAMHNAIILSQTRPLFLSSTTKQIRHSSSSRHDHHQKFSSFEVNPIYYSSVAATIVIIFTIRQLLFAEDAEYAIAPLEGPSMMPTILPRNGYYIIRLFDNQKTRDHIIQRGSVVVSKDPRWHTSNSEERLICKRVIALPGDTVQVHKKLEGIGKYQQQLADQGESYDKHEILEGFIWLEGDNPSWSIDSRNYGAVHSNLVIGQVIAQAWPLKASPFITRNQPALETNGYAGSESPFPSKVIPRKSL